MRQPEEHDVDDRWLTDAVRRHADQAEAAAPTPEEATDALHARLRRRSGLLPRAVATAAVALVAVLAFAVVRLAFLPPDVGGPAVLPSGLYMTDAPDGEGRCLAISLAEDAGDAGRAEVWAWGAADGCGTRDTVMSSGVADLVAVGLPAAGELPAREGFRVESRAGEGLGGISLILDPAGSPPGALAGYGTVQEAERGPHSVTFRPIEELDVEYVPAS